MRIRRTPRITAARDYVSPGEIDVWPGHDVLGHDDDLDVTTAGNDDPRAHLSSEGGEDR